MSKKRLVQEETPEPQWQEIFDTIDMEYLPLEYIDRILITFRDGTVWDIDVNDSRKKQPIDEIENSLNQLFESHDENIETIDFRLDLVRVQKDLTRRVNKFLKLNR